MSESGSFEGFLTFGTDGSFAFTFEDGSCGGAGKYRFLVKESVLSFIPLGDGCGERKAVLTGEWKRRGT